MPKIEFTEILDHVKIIDLSDINSNINLSNFKAKIEEYNEYLREHATNCQEQNVSHTHVLINLDNFDIIAYMTLLADSVCLLPKEKANDLISHIPFSTLPALKIGKLAVDESYRNKYHGIGLAMIKVARGFAIKTNQIGVACRYLTTDADIENNPTVVDFYRKCGFVLNEKVNSKTRRTISMRKDIFYD